MGRTLPLLLAVAATVAGCSGSDESTPTSAPVAAPTPSTFPADTAPAPTIEAITTTTAESTPTTIDEATTLADVEAAYLAAFEVGKEAIRNPNDPETEERIRAHFTGPNLDRLLEDLALTGGGGLVNRINESNPTFARIIEPTTLEEDDTRFAVVTSCEFDSDQLFEVGTGPGGADALRRDDPLSVILQVRMELVDGAWLSRSGERFDEARDEIEQCSEL